ncbi:MAG: energy transducer TonB [Paucibacter sp.]|nr:energy transducer TonB [Roseateles sp.]
MPKLLSASLALAALLTLGGPAQAQGQAQSEPAAAGANQHLRITHAVRPVYPAKARKEGLHGVVKVEVAVSAEGQIEEIVILDSPGDLLSDAVREALRQTRFKPQIKNGQAVATRMRQDFAFYP